MTPEETIKLARFVRAACPQQKFDEYTPDAWHVLLADLAYADAIAAVQAVVKRQAFVAPAEIRIEVARIRAERLRAHGSNAEPDYDADDVAGGLAAIRAHRRAIADGRVEPDRAITDGPRKADIEKLLRQADRRMPRVERVYEANA